MATYIIDFQSGGTETSPTIPGKTSIALPKNTINSSATTLRLTGQGVSLYGEIQQENFIRLLENFASKTAPTNPTIGQIWFDSVNNKLKVYDMNSSWISIGDGIIVQSSTPTTATEGALWYNTTENILYLKVNPSGPYANMARYFDTTWVQVWPGIERYAARTEYNTLAARVNKVIGTPQTSGAAPDVADNQWGWGETDTLPIFSSMNSPTQFDNNAWTTFLARLRKATRHLDQGLAPVTNIATNGFISDGRGANSTATTYDPSTSWTYGWNDEGIVTIGSGYTSILTAVTALEDNRFTIDATDTTWAVINTSTRPSWNQTKVLDLKLNWASQALAQAFFNAGGMVRFNISVTGWTTTLAQAWYNLFTNNNTFSTDYSTAGFCIDFRGCRLGPTGSYIGGGSSLGFYDLTTSYATLTSVARGGAYGAGSLEFEAKYDTTGGYNMWVQITFNEDLTGGSPSIDGTTSVSTQIRKSTGVVSGNPTVNTPTPTTPTITASGTFITVGAE